MTNSASLIVVDDFYDNFAAARRAAVEADYRSRKKVTAFAYQFAPAPQSLVDEAVSKLNTIVGPEFGAGLVKNHFRLSTGDEWRDNLARGARVHVDAIRWAGIVYLNDAEQCHGGTAFYQHKASGARHVREVLNDPPAYAAIMADGGDIESWLEVLGVGMVPNRAILFDAGQFHQAKEFFGDDVTSARLTHNFFSGYDALPEPPVLRAERTRAQQSDVRVNA